MNAVPTQPPVASVVTTHNGKGAQIYRGKTRLGWVSCIGKHFGKDRFIAVRFRLPYRSYAAADRAYADSMSEGVAFVKGEG